jgi:hypothetical protein
VERNLAIWQAFNGEVLAELPRDKVAADEPFLPVAIRLDLIAENRSRLTALAPMPASACAIATFDAYCALACWPCGPDYLSYSAYSGS